MSALLSRVPLLRILLTNTKVPRSTKVLVARVKDKINKVLNGFFLPRVLLAYTVINIIGSAFAWQILQSLALSAFIKY